MPVVAWCPVVCASFPSIAVFVANVCVLHNPRISVQMLLELYIYMLGWYYAYDPKWVHKQEGRSDLKMCVCIDTILIGYIVCIQ